MYDYYYDLQRNQQPAVVRLIELVTITFLIFGHTCLYSLYLNFYFKVDFGIRLIISCNSTIIDNNIAFNSSNDYH